MVDSRPRNQAEDVFYAVAEAQPHTGSANGQLSIGLSCGRSRDRQHSHAPPLSAMPRVPQNRALRQHPGGAWSTISRRLVFDHFPRRCPRDAQGLVCTFNIRRRGSLSGRERILGHSLGRLQFRKSFRRPRWRRSRWYRIAEEVVLLGRGQPSSAKKLPHFDQQRHRPWSLPKRQLYFKIS